MTGGRIHIALALLSVAATATLFVLFACTAEQAHKAPAASGKRESAPAACAKDTDCKGDRICEKGECISPR